MFFYNLIRSTNSYYEIVIAAFAFIVTALAAIILHECAHGFVALKMGDRTALDSGRLSVNPKAHFDLMGLLMFLLVGFGWARPVPINPSNFKNRKLGLILVSLAGVVTNLIMAGIALLIIFLCGKYIFYYTVYESAIIIILKNLAFYILLFTIQINMMLALFNLLPIFPLDGFNFINAFLPYGNKFSMFMFRYGSFCLLGLIILGYIFRLVGLPQLDIFSQFSNLISRLVNAAIQGGI